MEAALAFVVLACGFPPANAKASPLRALALDVGECWASWMARCSSPAEMAGLVPAAPELGDDCDWVCDRHMAAKTLFM